MDGEDVSRLVATTFLEHANLDLGIADYRHLVAYFGGAIKQSYCTEFPIDETSGQNGGGRSPQNPKKKTQFWWEHPCNHLVSPINIMNCIVQTFKFCDCPGKVNKGLKSQTPPYLPNGDSVKEFFYIIGFKTFENGGVGHLQISKK
jgi:hypothetical protein